MKNEISQSERDRVTRELYENDWGCRLIVWVALPLAIGFFFGIPISVGDLVWRAWLGIATPFETSPENIIGWVPLVFGWVYMFILHPLRLRRREFASRPETSSVQDAKVPSHPLEFCLRIFLSSQDCNNILNDLEEQFDLDCERFGRRRAQILRACDLGRSLWPFLSKAAGRLIRWGVFASAVEWVRRYV